MANQSLATRLAEPFKGVFLNLGSPLTAEMASRAGLDWVLLDYEHGPGGEETLLAQLQAVSCGHAVPVVRVAGSDPIRVKRALDLGAAGIMFPYVNSADAAQAAVASMRYPPLGNRGVSRFNRACGFGETFDDAFADGGRRLLAIMQIESLQALANVPQIAAVDGVDAVFVGPLDLSINLGVPGQTDAPEFVAACEQVVAAAKKAGKAAGILIPSMESYADTVRSGFTVIAIGSDGGFVAKGLRTLVAG